MNFPCISGQPELYIKINVLIKITFLLDPESNKVPEGNTQGAKDKELQCISLHLESIRLLKGIYHELHMYIYTHCALHRVNICRIRVSFIIVEL